jgi:hypothetical protein
MLNKNQGLKEGELVLRTSLVNLDIADARENFNAIVDLKN